MDAGSVTATVSLMQRARVLEACRDGPADRTTIAERAECSRATAYRATDDLGEQGLLERTDRGYRLSGAGGAILNHIQRFIENIEGTNQIRPMFDYVDSTAFIQQSRLFADADLIAHDADRPYHIESRVQEIIAGTRDRMLGMTSGLGSPSLAESMFDRARAGVKIEWILSPDSYEHFETEFGPISEQTVRDGQTAAYVGEDIPIDLAVYDETLLVIGFDRERGIIGAVAVTDDPAAVEWGIESFEACRRTSTQVD